MLLAGPFPWFSLSCRSSTYSARVILEFSLPEPPDFASLVWCWHGLPTFAAALLGSPFTISMGESDFSMSLSHISPCLSFLVSCFGVSPYLSSVLLPSITSAEKEHRRQKFLIPCLHVWKCLYFILTHDRFGWIWNYKLEIISSSNFVDFTPLF